MMPTLAPTMTPLGLAMFPLAMAAIAFSGLPAYLALLGVSLAFAVLGLATGLLDAQLLQALPSRLIGLLEHDLLQALVLYALVGALLHHLDIASRWLAVARRLLRRSGAEMELSALGLAALAAPMNGSVGASLAMLGRGVLPRLREAGVAAPRATALVAAASTLGVVVPPSLVLLLLGDALMRAHTEALQISHAQVQIINSQDVLRAALLPGGVALALFVTVALLGAWRARRRGGAPPQRIPDPLQAGDAALFGLSTLWVLVMLGLVTLGRLFAVEAAAASGCALLVYGLASGRLRGRWSATLDEAMQLSGMLIALLVAASTFTLVLRGLGTDQWLAHWLAAQQLGPQGAVLLVMGLLLLSAFALDAFELIFLLIPLLMPPLLAIVDDAAWVATLTLLVLQIGFLLPPLGYAVLMSRAGQLHPPSSRALAWALLPYLLGLLALLGAVYTWPALTHWGRAEPAAAAPALDSQAVDDILQQAAPGREAKP